MAISGGLVSHAGQNVLAWPNLAPVSDSDLNQQGLLISSGKQKHLACCYPMMHGHNKYMRAASFFFVNPLRAHKSYSAQ